MAVHGPLHWIRGRQWSWVSSEDGILASHVPPAPDAPKLLDHSSITLKSSGQKPGGPRGQVESAGQVVPQGLMGPGATGRPPASSSSPELLRNEGPRRGKYGRHINSLHCTRGASWNLHACRRPFSAGWQAYLALPTDRRWICRNQPGHASVQAVLGQQQTRAAGWLAPLMPAAPLVQANCRHQVHDGISWREKQPGSGCAYGPPMLAMSAGRAVQLFLVFDGGSRCCQRSPSADSPALRQFA